MIKSPKGLKAKIGKHWGLEEDALCFHFFRGLMITHFCCFSVSYFFSADQILCFFTEDGRWQLLNSFVTSFSLWGGNSIWSEQVPNCQRVSGTRAEASKSFIYKLGVALSIVGLLVVKWKQVTYFEVLELVYGFWPYYLGNMDILVFQFQVVFSSSSHLWEVIFDSCIKPVLRIWHLSLMSWEKWLLQLPPSLRTLMTSSKLSSGVPQRLPLVLLWCLL